jgi:hypothetical protein
MKISPTGSTTCDLMKVPPVKVRLFVIEFGSHKSALYYAKKFWGKMLGAWPIFTAYNEYSTTFEPIKI